MTELAHIFTSEIVQSALEELALCIRYFNQRGWCPATSSNFSRKLEQYPEFVFISRSGKDKSLMNPSDFMIVDQKGGALYPSGAKPSAETLIHTHLYENVKKAGCVLHTHSVHSALLTTAEDNVQALEFYDLEIQKVFPGIDTHKTRIHLPIVDNSQDMNEIWQALTERERIDDTALPAFLIRGHGLYAWGADLAAAKRHVEGTEFLLEYAERGGACVRRVGQA